MGLKGPTDKRAKKSWEIRLHSVWGEGKPSPLQPEVYTPAGELAGHATCCLARSTFVIMVGFGFH
jgi:hypothetical protein